MADRFSEDIRGVVQLQGGRQFRAGDEIPDDVFVPGELTQSGKDHNPAVSSSTDTTPEKSSTARRTKSGKSSSSRSSN